MPKSIDNAISFDTSLRPGSLSSKRLCKSFIKLIEEAEKNHQLRNRRRREKDQIAFEDIVSCIFANLCLSAIGNSNRPIRISRSHGRISPKSRYHSSVLGKTFPKIIDELRSNPPDLFICGHSHILKVINDKELNLLHINPGAIGKHGLHNVRTMIQFEISGDKIENLSIVEFKR